MPCDTSSPLPIGNYEHRSALDEEEKDNQNVLRISSPIDHVPVQVACFGAPYVQLQRLLSVICIRIRSCIMSRSMNEVWAIGCVRTSPSRP